jgi:hypothetical protein
VGARLRQRRELLRRRGTDGLSTHRWRKTDSNLRSLHEGKGYGAPLQASITVLGPEPVSGSASRVAVSDWQRPEEPFAGAGPMVRIRFPPAASHHAISIVFTLVGVPDSLPE